MKNLILYFLSCFLIKISIAQMPETKIVQPQSIQDNFPQAKFLFNTQAGKVYSLPLDNMPCIIALGNDPQPLAKIDLKGFEKIPNAIPEQKIIPEQPVQKYLIPKIYK